MPASARVGNQPDPGEGLDETRAVAGQHDVAGKGEAGAGPGGHPVDGTDHGEFQRADQPDEGGIEGPHRMAQIRLAGHLRRIAIAQVLTGTEPAARSGQEDRACIPVPRGLQRGIERAVHLVVEGVQPVRSVQGEFPPRSVIGGQDRIAHSAASP